MKNQFSAMSVRFKSFSNSRQIDQFVECLIELYNEVGFGVFRTLNVPGKFARFISPFLFDFHTDEEILYTRSSKSLHFHTENAIEAD